MNERILLFSLFGLFSRNSELFLGIVSPGLIYVCILSFYLTIQKSIDMQKIMFNTPILLQIVGIGLKLCLSITIFLDQIRFIS